MLVIPVSNKINWKNPPLLTAALIIINLFVFFLLQSEDQNHQERAYDYYVESGLFKQELKFYIQFRDVPNVDPNLKDLSEKDTLNLYSKMMRDETFLLKLNNNEVITEQDNGFESWRSGRDIFINKLDQSISYRYGFKPAEASASSSFTYMFLHGSASHVIGNMIFLWLFGCILETGCGRLKLVTGYLFTGITAALLFLLFNRSSMIPLVGASGAIAGLMGFFTILFGRKKVRIFYHIGFYFNYIKFPAILLLPIWVGKELYSQFTYSEFSSTAYLAHVGGLVGGSLFGLLLLPGFKKKDLDLFSEEPVDTISPLLDQATEHMQKLELAKARSLIIEVIENNRNHEGALEKCFHLDKMVPEDGNIHKSSQNLIIYHLKKGNHKSALGIYEEYKKIIRPKMSPVMLLKMANSYSILSKPEQAEKIISLILKKAGSIQEMPISLYKLGQCYLKTKNPVKAVACFKLILKKFPESQEANNSQNILIKMKGS